MKKTPDLMSQMPKKRGRPRKHPLKTAEQIAASMEQEAKRMLELADILRGKKTQ